jgi:hypothetical protein
MYNAKGTRTRTIGKPYPGKDNHWYVNVSTYRDGWLVMIEHVDLRRLAGTTVDTETKANEIVETKVRPEYGEDV